MATFKTGPVDPTKPMELDDGRPVVLSSASGDTISVMVDGPVDREGTLSLADTTWDYYVSSGVWQSGSEDDYFVLRNVGETTLTLSDDDAERRDFPMYDGLMAYFPNALAYVAKVSKIGNQQHNPGQPMHWARGKSTDHENKIMRHLADVGRKDGRGVRHSGSLAWRALANLQEELEREEGAPMSRGSRTD